MELDSGMVTALWGAVILSGIYHGANPGMGWPLAVSASLMERRRGAMARALMALGAGHLLAMTAILLPFSFMTALIERQTQIQIGAGVLVTAMGVYLLLNPRHPRILSRVAPTRLALWSFLAATAHGAGLMLVPIYLGIGETGPGAGHEAAAALMGRSAATALMVALAHTAAMTLTGGILAVAIRMWLGLKFLSRTWFNLDAVWALSLVAVGLFGIHAAYRGH